MIPKPWLSIATVGLLAALPWLVFWAMHLTFLAGWLQIGDEVLDPARDAANIGGLCFHLWRATVGFINLIPLLILASIIVLLADFRSSGRLAKQVLVIAVSWLVGCAMLELDPFGGVRWFMD